MTDLPFNYKYIWRLEKSVFLSTHARQADYSQVVCVFLFPPYSLHVWDTVLPDCLGMGWDGLRVCAVAHYLLQNRLLLWSGEPGEWQRKPLKDSAALHGDATVCICVCVRANIVKWFQACLLQSDRLLRGGPVSPCLSHLLTVLGSQIL